MYKIHQFEVEVKPSSVSNHELFATVCFAIRFVGAK